MHVAGQYRTAVSRRRDVTMVKEDLDKALEQLHSELGRTENMGDATREMARVLQSLNIIPHFCAAWRTTLPIWKPNIRR